MKSRMSLRNRVIWVLLFLLILTNFVVLAYIALRQPGVIIQQFRGEDGKSGLTVQGPQGPAGHTPIKGVDYFDGRDGRDGKDGQSIVGPQGPAGENGMNGTNGVDGQPGKTPEFDCQDGDLVTRYQGDDAWQTLQEDSAGCQEGI